MKDKEQNWIELTMIQVGGALCLPMIFIGHELVKLYGTSTAILAILLGNACLFLLAIGSGHLAFSHKRTTAESAAMYFGKNVKNMLSIILTISMCAWFALQTEIMTEDLKGTIETSLGLYMSSSYVTVSNVVLSVSIVISLCSGAQSLLKAAHFAVPAMAITVLIAIIFSDVTFVKLLQVSEMKLSVEAISIVMAAAIAAVVDLPTFFQKARSLTDINKACAAIFLIGMPLVEIAGAMLSHQESKSTIRDAFMCFDNQIWQLWIALFILLSGWTTNNMNLYSAAQNIETVFKKRYFMRLILVGAIATALSCFDLLSHFSLILEVMGIMISSMGGVLLTSFFIDKEAARSRVKKSCLSALIIGIAIGLIEIVLNYHIITGVKLIDAFLISAIWMKVATLGMKNNQPNNELAQVLRG